MNERRRYYRIKDLVSIHYQVLEGQNLQQELQEARIGYVKYSDLRNASQCIDARLDVIAGKLGKDNPLLAEALTLISRKFAIMELMTGDSKPEEVMQWPELEVSLSGSGIAFEVDQELLEDTPVKLEVILHPENHYITALGRVVSCRRNESGDAFVVAVDYESISDEDREHIIHHILKRQMEDIRENKKEPEKETAEVKQLKF
ncbi:MAG: PilZ domain-containing protein [Thiotrichales bacterium]|nr:PilZ domain-containing protein [Thiotrichales bacterium]